MALLKNKIFALIVCLVSFAISGFIFSDRVFGIAVRSNFDMGSGKITNLGTPTYSNDAATKNYVDTVVGGGSLWTDEGSYIYPKNASGIYITDNNKVGIGAQPGSSDTLKVNGIGRFTESLSVGSQGYGNTGDVIASGIGQFSTVQSTGVLSAQGNAYLWKGADMSNNRVTRVAQPVSNDDAATKSYVDSLSSWGRGSGGYGNYIYPFDYSNLKIRSDGLTIGLGLNETIGLSYSVVQVKGNSSFDGNMAIFDDFYVGGSIFDGMASSLDFGSRINMNSQRITYLGSPTYSDDAATKGYVDSALSGVNLWVDNGSYIRPKDSYYISLYDNGNMEASNLSISNTLFGRWITSDSLQSTYDTTVGRNFYANGNAKFDGNVGMGTSPSYSYRLDVYGNTNIQGTLSAYTKNFVIDHPLDPENKQLVHSSLEGPEVGVYYRGEAQLQNGKAEVILPSYFEALTRKENRTVLLTPKFENSEPISNLAASAVENGKFNIRAIDQNNPSQKFYWEVKAIRADVASLEVERLKINEEKK